MGFGFDIGNVFEKAAEAAGSARKAAEEAAKSLAIPYRTQLHQLAKPLPVPLLQLEMQS